jgi:hypothetical protein
LIQPYFEYCNIVWGQPSSHLDSLFRIQKKAVRVITNSKWKSHSKPLFDCLSILPLKQLHKFQLGCFMYKSQHGMLPTAFTKFFVQCTEIHHHNTRHSTKLHVFQSRLKIRADSIRISGVNLWNVIEIKTRNAQSFSVFKKLFKSFLLKDIWKQKFTKCNNTFLFYFFLFLNATVYCLKLFYFFCFTVLCFSATFNL